jgi:hypothetical protein
MPQIKGILLRPLQAIIVLLRINRQVWYNIGRMMKPNLLLILTLLISDLAFSAGANATDASKQVYGGVVIKEDSALKKLLVIPEIAAQYKSCQGAFPRTEDLDKISACLWSGDDNNNIPPLSKNQKDEVKKVYAQEDSGGPSKDNIAVDPKTAEIDVTSTKAKNTTSLTNRNLTIGTDYKSDPAVKVLSAFFGKKLDEVLNGSAQDKKDKKIVTVDHTEFIDLYTSELGKSIVNSFTSYCMETNPSCRDLQKDPADGIEKDSAPCLISKDEVVRKADIARNLKTINAANFTDAEGLSWQHCIGSVSGVCYDTSTDPNVAYSKQKACLVMDFVKSARKNLIIADQQKNFYNGLKGGGDKGIASIASNMKAANEKDLTADKLTQINSADIDKGFTDSDNKTLNISKTNDSLEVEATDCVGPDGKVTTKDKCSKFLDVNTTKNTDAVTEFGLRQFAKADDLDKKLENKDTVGSYLKEEGYTDDQIKNLTSADKIEEVKLKIKERFNSEKDAIIKEMASRVTAKTTVTDGSIDKDKDLSPLTKIKEELGTRNGDLKNLIHFDNIVASYLTISELNADGSIKKGSSPTRNTASLFAEVKSMDDKKESKVIMEKIKNNKDLQEGQTSPEFKIDDINKLLKYTEDQKVPTQNP